MVGITLCCRGLVIYYSNLQGVQVLCQQPHYLANSSHTKKSFDPVVESERAGKTPFFAWHNWLGKGVLNWGHLTQRHKIFDWIFHAGLKYDLENHRLCSEREFRQHTPTKKFEGLTECWFCHNAGPGHCKPPPQPPSIRQKCTNPLRLYEGNAKIELILHPLGQGKESKTS